jgi:2-keto-4-pentenoate hydratase/2-oxohepta-3-ene-1,7-dioic acid hydratase in catechol pathway
VRLDCDPELVFVIGRRALGVTDEDDETDYIAGVTLMTSLSDADLHRREAAVIGPELVTIDEIGDPYDLWITCAVNGEERIRVHTGDQLWKMSEILEHFSRGAALEPGDLFSTGARGGLAAGRTVLTRRISSRATWSSARSRASPRCVSPSHRLRLARALPARAVLPELRIVPTTSDPASLASLASVAR